MNGCWRKYKLIASFLLWMVAMLSGCSDYLCVSDEIAESLDLETVFKNPDYARQWHANLFNCISEYSCTGGNDASGFTNVWSSLCGETLISSGPASRIMEAGYNSSTAPYHRWWQLYREIRDSFIFLKRVVPLGSVDDEKRLTEESVRRMRAEAKFLIAYSYFSLFELYGPVPLVTEEVDPESKQLNFARASVDEVVNYIDRLLEEVIRDDDLPHSLIHSEVPEGNGRYNLNEIVRPTRSAVLALRAKLWVYAASPLFNGGFEEALAVRNKDGKSLFPVYTADKWKTAKCHLERFFEDAETCGNKLFKVVDDKGNIDVHRSIYELFQAYNDEVIWATGKNYYHYGSSYGIMEENTNPRDLYRGWAHVCLTQESVDGFFMNDGLSIDDSGSTYREDGFAEVLNPCNDVQHVDKMIYTMYANREPRFYASVTYEGKSWHIQPWFNNEWGTGFAKGEGCDNSVGDFPRNGYLLYKFKNRKIMYTGDYIKKWARPSILFRLADFYLYYAEVCNEIDPKDSHILDYLDRIRERAGIPGYRELAALGKKNIIGDQTLQRKAIQQERKVELLGEGQRFFDVRRWMICDEGEDADQRFVHGMNMNGDKNESLMSAKSFYRRTLIEKRAWKRAMYLHPIPFDELQVNELMVQNPLW